jgi:hypothetical protein
VNITGSTPSLANTFIFSDPNSTRQILPGQWVLDATLFKSSGADSNNSGAAGRITPLANFYRITNVRSIVTGTPPAVYTVLDVQTPIRGYTSASSTATAAAPPSVYPSTPGGSSPSAAVLIVQDALVEVIDIGPLR